jgi:hypothetical protein
MCHFSSLKKEGQMLIMDTKECVQWRAFIHGGLDCGSSLLFLISFFFLLFLEEGSSEISFCVSSFLSFSLLRDLLRNVFDGWSGGASANVL